MSSVNKVILVGNLGTDPEVRHLESGSAVAQFRLATNETYKDKSGNRVERTEWHNIVAWRGLAEVAEKYMRKGQSVYVEGKIRTRQYQDKDNQTRYVTEIVADEITMLGGGRGPGEGANGHAQQPAQAADKATAAEQKTFRQQPEMDELPF
ncbi:single-stranded DNA-binding protein [Hymenobacter sp. B81]|uniref:single-stranded DNA-binding protein n=1 Tax=Hymenobacter sp. B81 TaxID=3344878 RepID=UPI0037DD6AB9